MGRVGRVMYAQSGRWNRCLGRMEIRSVWKRRVGGGLGDDAGSGGSGKGGGRWDAAWLDAVEELTGVRGGGGGE